MLQRQCWGVEKLSKAAKAPVNIFRINFPTGSANGWQDYNDGGVVTSATFVMTSEGYVEFVRHDQRWNYH
ncbi:hypothetical protein EMIT051CA3_90001 [Pseudomonas chlororaphis]